jgi:hypothetical protein
MEWLNNIEWFKAAPIIIFGLVLILNFLDMFENESKKN